jgi:ferredoxin
MLVYASLAYGSLSVFFELSLLILIPLLPPASDPSSRAAVALAAAAASSLFIGRKHSYNMVLTLLPVAAGCAVILAHSGDFDLLRPIPAIIAASILPGFILYAAGRKRKNTTLRKVDIILCSYSGNTGHAASKFVEGIKEEKVDVVIHRFHHHRVFHADLSGDGLVLAFPVIGWKPPWPLCSYIIRKMPRGGGKPAFVIYTAGGGPENAGMVAWLLLTLKGYRVVGRGWAVYPINIATVRIGPKRMWRFLDNLLPRAVDSADLKTIGRDFARGVPGGHPFILWPFPLIIAGVLLENPPLNRAIYRSYVWRKRCIQCGLCVRYCPSERLRMEPFPKARGDCCLCLGCVNICPKKAMQMAAITEYGNQYWPRWPEYVVKQHDDNCNRTVE